MISDPAKEEEELSDEEGTNDPSLQKAKQPRQHRRTNRINKLFNLLYELPSPDVAAVCPGDGTGQFPPPDAAVRRSSWRARSVPPPAAHQPTAGGSRALRPLPSIHRRLCASSRVRSCHRVHREPAATVVLLDHQYEGKRESQTTSTNPSGGPTYWAVDCSTNPKGTPKGPEDVRSENKRKSCEFLHRLAVGRTATTCRMHGISGCAACHANP